MNFEQIAKNEKPIAAEELLEEIFPLLEDYFLGTISFDKNVITYNLPNGQNIIIRAEAVC